MFYIGRTTVKKIQHGYRGTVTSKLYKSIWIEELSNNPHLFKTKILTLHETKLDSAIKEEYFHKKFQVHKNPLYINQATGFGTFHADIKGKKNHFYGSNRSGFLNPMYGKTHSDASRQKMSRSGKGKHSQPKTESFKQHMSDIYSGKTYEERFGVERAAEIKAKQKSPKSAAQKQKQSEVMKNKPNSTCPHCGKQARGSNYVRWHGDNCKLFGQKISNEL